MKIIDPHLHLFDLVLGDYQWLAAENPPFWPDKAQIYRNFTVDDLLLDDGLTLEGLVHIEAGFDNAHPERELAWLSQTVNFPYQAVACIDLTFLPKGFNDNLVQLKQQQNCVGVRHILDEHALSILTHPHCKSNLTALAQQHLLFECQMSFLDTKAITALSQLLTQIANLKIIINHSGFAPLHDEAARQLWLTNAAHIAKHPNVAIKCSGWEMQARQYQLNAVKRVIHDCINIFGSERVMLASNFPLTLFSTSYSNYWHQLLQALPEELFSQISYLNTKRWYDFS